MISNHNFKNITFIRLAISPIGGSDLQHVLIWHEPENVDTINQIL